VQVISDMLGLFTDFVPKHAKQYTRLADAMKTAFANYMSEVQSGKFPGPANSFSIDESIIEDLGRCCTPHK
jgi:3-methyl-2-oxobutanoate hydroxymethyltransferase